jgi:hypothetical protein
MSDNYCLGNGVTGNYHYYIAGCTDPSYLAPACSTHCKGQYSQTLGFDNSTNEWECCNTYNLTGPYPLAGCSIPEGTERWSTPLPADLTTVISLEGTYTPTILITATSPASTTSTKSTSSIGTRSSANSTISGGNNSTDSNSGNHSGLSTGAKAGIGVGVGLGVALTLFVFGMLFVRQRQRKQAAVAEFGIEGVNTDPQGRVGELGGGDPEVELPSGQDPQYAIPEMGAQEPIPEMEANAPQELLGSDVLEMPK